MLSKTTFSILVNGMDQTTTSNQRSNGLLAFACLLLTIGLSVAWAGGKKTRKLINKYIIGQKNV